MECVSGDGWLCVVVVCAVVRCRRHRYVLSQLGVRSVRGVVRMTRDGTVDRKRSVCGVVVYVCVSYVLDTF